MIADRPHPLRCAIYTRKSSEEGLDQAFNSLDAQREACEAYIKSQAGEGWHPIRTRYDDGGLSGGTLERAALQQLLGDIKARKVDTVVVYKVDRLTRSLADFAKIVEVFDAHGVAFVSVTQQFNTTTSMGRLTLNMLLSFAQFEREVTGERIRDKIAASKKKGMWMGGFVPLGYEAQGRTLTINQAEAETVRTLFRLYLEHGNVRRVKAEADQMGLRTKIRPTAGGGGRPLSRGYIYKLLNNPLYAGRIAHKSAVYEGQHPAIVDTRTWDAAQAKLSANAQDRRTGVRAAEPSLLTGLLHDRHGNRLSPSHAVKKGVRYRYYVSQAVLQHQEADARSVTRIPAREIEDLVRAQISTFLKDPAKLIDEVGTALGPRDQARLMAAAKTQAELLPQLAMAEQRAFLLSTVAGVTVSEMEVGITLRRSALRAALLGGARSAPAANWDPGPGEAPAAPDELVIRIPARLKLCSGEMRLMIPPAQTRALRPRPNAALIKALTRTQRWRLRLFSDPAFSLRAIARDEGLGERYVSHLLPLAFLAPDIAEAILDGYQPEDLDLERLLQSIPLSWIEQRRRFRFATDS